MRKDVFTLQFVVIYIFMVIILFFIGTSYVTITSQYMFALENSTLLAISLKTSSCTFEITKKHPEMTTVRYFQIKNVPAI